MAVVDRWIGNPELAGGSHTPNRASPEVEIDSSPVYELLLTLLEFGYARNGCEIAGPLGWYGAVRERLSANVLAAFDELAPSCWLWHSLLFRARAMRARRQTVHTAQFIEWMRAIDAARLYEALLGCQGRSMPITRGDVAEAVTGNPAARLRIGKALFPEEPEEDRPLVRFLSLPPPRVKELLISIIEGWYVELFRSDERELAMRLANEARTKRVIGGSSPSRLLRASTIGLHYLPRRAVKRILLVPSIITRPSIITIRYGRARLFFYPLPDEYPDGEELPAQLVKIHSALADAGRLRILRSLIRTDRTLESLSRELAESPQCLNRHLIILRDAGLVTLRMDERRMSFEIRQNLPSVIFRTLQAYLPEPARFAGDRG